MIQSVLLMGFWYTDPQDHTGAWYWVGVAISLAQSIGIHRDGKKSYNNVLPVELQSLTRRIWWACVVRDRWVSLAKGRPMRVHDEDCDVPMPSRADIADEINQCVAPDLRKKYIPSNVDALSEMWVSLVEVSVILGRIMRIHYRVKGPKPSITDIEELATELFQLEESRSYIMDDQIITLIHSYHLEIYHRCVHSQAKGTTTQPS